ncbi:MAG: hypothetical protein AAF629_24955, partial [Chloroflexota bacterium]
FFGGWGCGGSLQGNLQGGGKNVLYALNQTPFMATMIKQDSRVLGSYLRKKNNFFRDKKNQSARYEFVKMMQEVGAIRTDIDPKVTAWIMNALAHGLVAMDEIMDPSVIPPADDIIEGIADLLGRALTPDDGGNKEAGKAVIKQISAAARAQFEAARKSDE